MTNIIPIHRFWNSRTIPIPICTEIGSANLFLFLFAGKITIRWSLVNILSNIQVSNSYGFGVNVFLTTYLINRENVYCLSGYFQNWHNITVFTYITYTARAILVKTSCSVQVPAKFSSYHCREVSFNPMDKFFHFIASVYLVIIQLFHCFIGDCWSVSFWYLNIFFLLQTAHAFFLCKSLGRRAQASKSPVSDYWKNWPSVKVLDLVKYVWNVVISIWNQKKWCFFCNFFGCNISQNT